MQLRALHTGTVCRERPETVALFWLFLAGLCVYATGGESPVQFPGPATTSYRFSHLVIDYKTEKIFAAATNKIFQLNSNLVLEKIVSTGPRNDSPQCHATGCGSSDIKLSLMDNYNKILLIEPDSRTLLTCGSLSQGACYKYKLNDIGTTPEFISISVAANDANASTYAYIGPKGYNLWGRPNILYVGTTFTNTGEYRHDVPAIASRNLDTLDYAEYSFSKQSLLNIDVKYRDHFIVQYIYGFNASNYAYFLIVQKQSHLPGQEEQGYVSRLSRTCINDPNYDSYTEVTLQCVDNDQKYNLVQDAKITSVGSELASALGISVGSHVLVAVFRPSRGITNEPQSHSALCIYPLRDIEIKFNENIHMCFNGSVKYRNMGYVSGPIQDGKCPSSGTAGNVPNFCEVGLKISGATPIVTYASLIFPNVSLSAVATASTGRHVLAFLGTTDGSVKKVLLSSQFPTEYEEIVVDKGHAILPDTTLSPSGEHLYVLSTSQITKIKVEHCSSYSNCSSCLESKDPYCGWCSLEKKCTVKSACQKATHSSPRWLSLGTGQQCIDFEQVYPEQIPITQMAKVKLIIKTLPDLPIGAKYKCVFGKADPIDAEVNEYGLACYTPSLSQRPRIPSRQDHTLVPLSVRSSETNQDFVSRNFAYYDCSRHSTCRECVRSQWACNWCVYENKCSHNISSCQRTVISGENNPMRLSNHGFSFCPQFRNRNPILLPNNVPKEMKFEVENLPYPQAGHMGFQCITNIEGATMLVPARVDSGKYIICDKTMYSYEAIEGEYIAEVQVVWNKKHHIDSANVTLYKCDILGSHREHADCSLCVTRNSKYHCTWCGNSCSYRETCLQIPHVECPRPRIDMIKPLSGPIEGGTLVTIEGSNLGLKKSDVQGKIRIGDVPCTLVNYEVSVKIQCVTGPSKSEKTVPIIVGNLAGFTESSVEFSYKDIVLSGIYPSIGPQSGGTQLAITGQYLNIGTDIKAYLDNYICTVNVTQASSSRLLCITSKAERPVQISRLTLSIDGANRTLSGNPFNYTLDPTIMEIKPLTSFASGGRMIFVHGTNLDSIQQPEMEVFLYNKPTIPLNKTLCTVLSAIQMECPSPSVYRQFVESTKSSRYQRSLQKPSAMKMPEAQLVLKVGFVMDDVQTVRDLDKHFPNIRSQLVYVEDPKFFKFPNDIYLYKGETLVIEGENLNSASEEADVVVTVGDKPCNISGLASVQLVCYPPEQQPQDTDEHGIKTDTNLPLVVVRVGKNLRFPLGHIKYDMFKNFAFPPEAVAMIITVSILFLFFFLAVLIVYRRKSTQAEREYKRIQIQMDTLESNVRSECKLAFAELQTDMTDLTADLENSGIPTLDHTNYVMKVFFPGVSDHPILNSPKIRLNGPRTNYDSAMLQFEQLINNKYFVLTFIEILESQKLFTIRDKVSVASLLMVVLMDKMEYATDILKCLLLRLIDKSEKPVATITPTTSDSLESTRGSPFPGRPQQMRCRNMPQDEDNESKLKRFEIYLSNTPTLQGLCELSWSGIPVKVRPIVWRLLSGYLPMNLERRNNVLERKRQDYWSLVNKYYYADHDENERDIKHQINIDVPRMNPTVPLFQQKTVQAIFERILFIWSTRHPASGYVQGINDLVTPFYVVFLQEYIPSNQLFETFNVDTLSEEALKIIEADSFWCLSKFLDGIQDNYVFAQIGIQKKVLQLEELITRVDETLHRHLKSHNVSYLQFSFRWLNNLLTRELPLRCTIRLWDTYLAESDNFASFQLYVCAAFLLYWKEDLMRQNDFQGLLILLQNLPTQVWSSSQVSLLVAEAYKLKYMFADAPNHLQSNRAES